MKTASNDTRTRRSCSTPSSQRQCAVKKGPANEPTRYQPESAEGGVRLEEGSGPRQHRPKKRRQEENRRVNQRWRARGARYGVPMGTMYRCMSMLPWAASLRPVFQASGRLFLRRGWRHSWLRARLVCFVQPRPTWLRWRPRRLSPLNALIPQRGSRNVCRVCLCKRLPRTPCRGLWVCVWPRGP